MSRLWISDPLLPDSHLPLPPSPLLRSSLDKPSLDSSHLSLSASAFADPSSPYSFSSPTPLRSRPPSRRPRAVIVRCAASPGSPDEFDFDNDDIEFDKELRHYRGLVLDVTYRPINIVCWKRALCLEILEKAVVLEYYDHVISSPSKPFAIPAVLRITDYVHAPKRSKLRLSLSRRNIFLRDKFRCQYCKSDDNLTIDHIVPISRGGEWTWQNLVTACFKCNSRKSDKTPEEANMKLIKIPREPGIIDGRDLPSNYATYRTLQRAEMPSEWIDYLPERTHRKD